MTPSATRRAGQLRAPRNEARPPATLDDTTPPAAQADGAGNSLSGRARWRGDALALLGLTALAAVQLWQAAGPGRLPSSLDLMLQFVPNAAYLGRSLSHLHLPLWNPYLGAGMPFAADPGTATWYLPAWPLLGPLPLYAAVRALLWLHLLWAAAGVYLYGRRALCLSPAPALLTTSAFSLTTWLPGLAGMPVVLFAISWLPWLLLCGEKAARRGGGWVAALAVVAALQALSGWPAGAYLTWLGLGLLLVLHWPGVRGAARVLAGGLTAALLAGILLLPAAEFVGQTNYAETRPLERVAHDGYLTLLSWLRPAGGTGTLESSQLYLGILPLLLAFAGLLFGRRRQAIRFGVLAALSLVIASGTHQPLFGLLYRWLPGFRIVYLPARFGVLAAFALACLAGFGAERLIAGPWTRRHATAVAALALLSPPLLLMQFWQSEGYDDFRRLLTNLGRLSGGPFLTRQQEAHYLVVALLGLLAIAPATRRPRRWLVAALLLLTAIDLATAQWEARPPSFDPAAWYRPAVASAAAAQSIAGHDRIAGPQWHDGEHFLDRFPDSADPRLLPPNTALLVGARDTQAYNPLLLRRAVDYYASLNHGERDDHWLWLADFSAPAADALAVRRVLATDQMWRVTDRPVAGPSRLPPDGSLVNLPLTVGPAASRLELVTYLGEATAVTQGTPAIEVTISFTSGTIQTFTLDAGLQTAEWAYGRPDVQVSVRHRQAPVALRTRLTGAVGGVFDVFEYLATAPLSDPSPISAITARSLLPGVTAYVQGIWAAARGASDIQVDDSGVVRQTALPRLRFDGGTATFELDEPEHVVARVSSPSGGSVVLADSFYPGWEVRIDSRPSVSEPVNGLFRGVDVPAGEHRVEWSYAPGSLKLGLSLSGAGLLTLAALVRFRARLR